MNSRLLALAALLTASLLISGCISQQSEQGTKPLVILPPKEKVSVKFSVKGASEMVGKTIEAEKGANAFDEMKKAFVVDYSMSQYGAFVNAINGESAQQGSYWALYVDGNPSMVGISSITLDKNMEISWRIEQIQMT